MLTIRNKQGEKLMVTTDIMAAKIRESINREYNLGFSVLYDYEKTQHIKPTNIAEIDGDWFDIVYIKESHNEDGNKVISTQCEHVTYRLNDEEYDLEQFVASGEANEILTKILKDTPFNVGNVEIDGTHSFIVQEEMSRRAILIMFAEQLEAELVFHRFTVSLLKKRGKDEGQQFRIGKNAKGIAREIDAREKTENGDPKVAYEVNIVELGYLHGYGNLENIELGDTWKVIDDELQLITTQRVVSYEYDPINKVSSNVEIANFIDDLSDQMFKMQKETVHKDTVYNGVRVGPDVGFEAIRSDNLARTVMNATEGLRIQKGNGSGSGWQDVIFLDTEGNAWFTGTITGSKIIADSTIDVGTDLKVGNMIYVGRSDQVDKGIVFSQIAQILYSGNALEVTGGAVTLSAGGGSGRINIISGNEVFIEAGNRTVISGELVAESGVNGVRLDVRGTELIVYKNGSYVGSIELGLG